MDYLRARPVLATAIAYGLGRSRGPRNLPPPGALLGFRQRLSPIVRPGMARLGDRWRAAHASRPMSSPTGHRARPRRAAARPAAGGASGHRGLWSVRGWVADSPWTSARCTRSRRTSTPPRRACSGMGALEWAILAPAAWACALGAAPRRRPPAAALPALAVGGGGALRLRGRTAAGRAVRRNRSPKAAGGRCTRARCTARCAVWRSCSRWPANLRGSGAPGWVAPCTGSLRYRRLLRRGGIHRAAPEPWRAGSRLRDRLRADSPLDAL